MQSEPTRRRVARPVRWVCRLAAAGAVAALAAWPPVAAARAFLTQADVERVIGQAAAKAERLGLPVAIAVVDKEGAILGAFRMAGARTSIVLRGRGRPCEGLEGVPIPLPDPPPCPGMTGPFAALPFSGAMLAAISKAGTGAFFATQGNAFTPRTAGFIIQPHFPPGVSFAPSGPLFGVQFSSLLICSDINPKLPLGLSADPGGLPLYKNGQAAGGVGVEGDGKYTADFDPSDDDVTLEERIATAATRGLRAPRAIRADRILVGGLRFPFANTADEGGPLAVPFATLVAGCAVGVSPCVVEKSPEGALASQFVAERIGGVRGEVDPRFFPPVASTDPPPAAGGLTDAEVLRILTQGARRADRLRAAIRRPLGDRARVSVSVVDAGGTVLGIFRTEDAPVFGFDVSVQKARTAAFFSHPGARQRLLARAFPGLPAGVDDVPLDAYVQAAARDGLGLDGTIAFSDRAGGFLSRPFFPDGIDGTRHGPFSRPIGRWSIFNTGLQADLLKPAVVKFLVSGMLSDTCTGVPGIPNGIQIFPGSVPLYRGRTLVGGVGVSGDGVDQDDAVALAASRGFAAPKAMRADRVRVRGVRLPFVKLPRQATDR